MKLVTWNVNGIRSRMERALALLERHQPDVVCLQETKVIDDEFPFEEFRAAGYRAEVLGQPTYNGVAILSREEVTDVVKNIPDDVDDPQTRLIAATADGVRVIGVYCPNGSSVGSDKYEYKLKWFDRLRTWLDESSDPSQDLVICGDFNVAPDDRDVYDPEKFRGKVLFSDPEHKALNKLLEFGLTDSFREFEQGEGLYTWWDYRQLGFQKRRGLRIDHVLVTKSLLARTKSVVIDKDERRGKGPSDHAPVLAEFE